MTFQKFLAKIAPNVGEGYRAVIAIHPFSKAIDACGFNAECVAEAEQFVASHVDEWNIYWTVNTTRDKLDKKPKKADMQQARMLHVDVDTLDPEALNQLRELNPTMIIASGGGYQGFWVLENPLDLGNKDIVAEIEDRNRGLASRIPGSDASAWNCDRIMRLPGTTNFPTAAKRRKGRTESVPAKLFERHTDRRYKLADFEPKPKEAHTRSCSSTVVGEPQREKYKSGSEHLLACVRWAMIRGYPDEHVHAIYRAHEHAANSGNAERAVQRCIDLVRPSLPAGTSVPEIRLRSISEIVAEQREVSWLVRDVLEEGVLALLVGPRGSYKSFIALDWSLKVAQERDVVMLSGEGGGLDRRIAAWCRHFEVDVDSLSMTALERAVPLNRQRVLEMLTLAIEQAGIRPALIVIDTFSKFAAGTDENDNSEVATFLAHLSSELRDRFGCTVLIVAHTGHADKGRPRGASTLMANPDAEYVVSVDSDGFGDITVTRERFKDSPSLKPLGYRTLRVDLGRLDKYGDEVTSLVVLPERVEARPETKQLGKHQQALIKELVARQDAVGQPLEWKVEEIRKIARDLGTPKASAHDAIESLAHRKLIDQVGNKYRLTSGAMRFGKSEMVRKELSERGIRGSESSGGL